MPADSSGGFDMAADEERVGCSLESSLGAGLAATIFVGSALGNLIVESVESVETDWERFLSPKIVLIYSFTLKKKIFKKKKKNKRQVFNIPLLLIFKELTLEIQ